MRIRVPTKFVCLLMIALTAGAGPLNAAVECLGDTELRVVVRAATADRKICGFGE